MKKNQAQEITKRQNGKCGEMKAHTKHEDRDEGTWRTNALALKDEAKERTERGITDT